MDISFFSLHTVVASFLLLLPFSCPVSFQITRFDPNDNTLILEGGATNFVGTIVFNSDLYMCQVGRVTYANKVPIWDRQSGKLTDFSTHFAFYIDVQGRQTYAAGFAFFLAPVGFHIPPNSAGGFLGLFNITTSDSSHNQILHVEFDTFPNPEWDPPVQHVGINNNSVVSATYTPWNVSLHSGDTADVWITYNGTTKSLYVSWKYQTTSVSQENTSLSYIIDLREVLPEWVTIGKETAETVNLTSINDDLERKALPRRFSLNDLVSATRNFSDERKLGEGGFGAVYKGYLADLDITVAVKKISRSIELIGWCHEGREFVLVYEFMPNGSLDSHLFGKKSPLTWEVRYRIALGLASALLYLHEEWEQCVVHRDVKSSNVMLDSSFNVKLGDFGLARLMDHELGPQTTGLAGTLGYLAPEYISTGRASKESDVYSFGVVTLEIVTGRKAVDPLKHNAEMSLLQWLWDLYGSKNLSLAFDKKLRADFNAKHVEHLMIIGLWCAHPNHSLRPSIRQAIQVLNFEAALPNLPKNMPFPFYHVPTVEPLPASSHDSLIGSDGVASCSSINIGR
ncbi:hypothetical protein K2173_014757 [Erythroxylum novogranatense]|uniref:Protein kinase domain-containing protein n=1 Tax=Erythroxylum novogranatense TaxID=1862640 RepID=A0AAV8TH98_9ROSI|nr:hypothetical protein K2173_014757 [Erythroxylum novogranatense]